jgi:CRP/FNR family transcriptional regulator, cyclic AMP receptor protein
VGSIEAAAFLKTVPLFSDLEPVHLEEISRLTRPFEAAAGQSLFRQGDRGDGMYVLESGTIEVTTRLLGDNKVALNLLRRGDLLGEMSIIDGRPRSASARCHDAARGYFLGRSHFAMLRAELHPLALRLMRSLARVLSQRQRAFNLDIAAIQPPVDWNAPARSIPPPAFATPRELPTEQLSRDALRSIPLFAVLDASELDELLAFAKAWVLPRGHVLFESGQAGTSCFITVRGAVRLALSQGTWSETLAILGPGRTFGHMSLVDGGARSTTCIVRENAIILELNREVFETWYERGNPLAFELLEVVTNALVDGLRSGGRLMARFAVEGRVRQRVKDLTLTADQMPAVPIS